MKRTIFSVTILGATLAATADKQFLGFRNAKNNVESIETGHFFKVRNQNLDTNDSQFSIKEKINQGLEKFADNHQTQIEAAINAAASGAEHLVRGLETITSLGHKQDLQFSLKGDVEQGLEKFADNHQTQIEGAINAAARGAEHFERGLETITSLGHKQDLEFSIKGDVEQGLEKFADNHQTQIEGAINAAAGGAEHFERGLEKISSIFHGQNSASSSQVADMMNNNDDEFNFISTVKNDAQKTELFYKKHQNAINSAVQTGIQVGKIFAGDENDNEFIIRDYLSHDSNLLSLKGLESKI